jgi:cell division septum initiation protein DivIVA
MPDQSSAAQEHALIEQITGPLATLPENPVAMTANVDFPIALRGYDRLAVDAYVARTSQLIAELHATASPEGAIRRALERVGEEVSGVLQQAHSTAGELTAQSRAEAENRLEQARQEAALITVQAREKLRTLDEDADRIWAERDRIIGDARDLARQLIGLADAAAERFPAAEAETPREGLTVAEHEPQSGPQDEPQHGPQDEPEYGPEDEPEDDPEDAEATAVFWSQAVADE